MSISYFTKADLPYTDSIELFYGTTSKSIPITITAETPTQVTTRIYPDTLRLMTRPEMREHGGLLTSMSIPKTAMVTSSETPI